jgi:hypothetical protein
MKDATEITDATLTRSCKACGHPGLRYKGKEILRKRALVPG